MSIPESVIDHVAEHIWCSSNHWTGEARDHKALVDLAIETLHLDADEVWGYFGDLESQEALEAVKERFQIDAPSVLVPTYYWRNDGWARSGHDFPFWQ